MKGGKTMKSKNISALTDFIIHNNYMSVSTKNGKLSVVNKLFYEDLLSDEEKNDVTTINIDHLFSRVYEKCSAELTPQSISYYRSRLTAAIRDFKKWLETPDEFRFSQHDKSNFPFQIPLRNGEIIIKINGLPFDLTTKEAQKINAILMLLAQDSSKAESNPTRLPKPNPGETVTKAG